MSCSYNHKHILSTLCLLTSFPYDTGYSAGRAINIEQIQTDLSALKALPNFSSASKSVADKIDNLTAMLPHITGLPPYQISNILNLIGIDSGGASSIAAIINSGLDDKKEGVVGATSTATVHSKLNNIISILVQEAITNTIGLSNNTAAKEGRTIWARLKYLQEEVVQNTPENIKSAIDEVYTEQIDNGADGISKQFEKLSAAVNGINTPDDIASQITAAQGILSSIKSTIVDTTIPFFKQDLTAFEQCLDSSGEAGSSLKDFINALPTTKFDEAISTIQENFLNTVLNLRQTTLVDVVSTLKRELGRMSDADLEGEVQALKTLLHSAPESGTFSSLTFKDLKDAVNKVSADEIANLPPDIVPYIRNLSDVLTAIMRWDNTYDEKWALLEGGDATPSEASEAEQYVLNVEADDLLVFGVELAGRIEHFKRDVELLPTGGEKVQDVDKKIERIKAVFDQTVVIDGDMHLTSMDKELIQTVQDQITNARESMKNILAFRDIMNHIQKIGQDVDSATPTYHQVVAGAVSNELNHLGNRPLTKAIEQLDKSYTNLPTDNAVAPLMGDPTDLNLRGPYTFCSMLHLLDSSITNTAYIWSGATFGQIQTSITELQNTHLADAINRQIPVSTLEEKFANLYKQVVVGFKAYFGNTTTEYLSFPLATGGSIAAAETQTMNDDLNQFFLDNNGANPTFETIRPANLAKIAQIALSKWPELTYTIGTVIEDMKEIYLGDKIQNGRTFTNLTYDIRSALYVDQVLTRIGRSGDKSEITLLSILAKKLPTLNYDWLVLVRNLLEKCPVINFLKTESGEMFIVWLDQQVGLETDVSDTGTLFGLVNSDSPITGDLTAKLDLIPSTLNQMIKNKKSGYADFIQDDYWFKYENVFAALENMESSIVLDQEIYARPLIFQMQGEPGVTTRSTLYANISKISGDKEFWATMGAHSALSLFNYVKRTIWEGYKYLSMEINALDPKTIHATFIDDLPNVEPHDTGSIYGLLDGFETAIDQIVKQDGDNYYILGRGGTEDAVGTNHDHFQKALEIINVADITQEKFTEKIKMVYNCIKNARRNINPIRLEKIIEDLQVIQDNLSHITENIPQEGETSVLAQTIQLRYLVGRSMDEAPEMRSILGRLNHIIRECGAQLLAQIIGEVTLLEEGSIMQLLWVRKMEARTNSQGALLATIQKGQKDLNEIRNSILSKYLNIHDSGQMESIVTELNGLIALLSNDWDGGESLADSIASVRSAVNPSTPSV